MLASANKLTGSKNFEKVKEEGGLFQRKWFGISILDRKDKKPSRFGFIVSKKIAKEAVQRNRVKRALREAVRYSLSRIKPGYDVVFLTKKSILKKSTDDIMNEVRYSLKEAGIY